MWWRQGLDCGDSTTSGRKHVTFMEARLCNGNQTSENGQYNVLSLRVVFAVIGWCDEVDEVCVVVLSRVESMECLEGR